MSNQTKVAEVPKVADKSEIFPNPFLYGEATSFPFVLTPATGEKIVAKAKVIVEMLTFKGNKVCK